MIPMNRQHPHYDPALELLAVLDLDGENHTEDLRRDLGMRTQIGVVKLALVLVGTKSIIMTDGHGRLLTEKHGSSHRICVHPDSRDAARHLSRWYFDTVYGNGRLAP